MFGAIVSSRPIITNLQTISQTQFAFNIPSLPAFTHIGIFLLPGSELPAGTGAAVYIKLPSSPDFRLLGAIANEKPSAIFRFSGAATKIGSQSTVSQDDAMIDEVNEQAVVNEAAPTSEDIIVGISIEPAENILVQLAALKSSASTLPASGSMELVRHQRAQQPGVSGVPTKVLAQRIIKNAFNFLSSFAGGAGGNETVPLKSFQNWWTKFEKKIELDPGFLEREDQD